MFSVKNSSLLLVSDNNLFCASFPAKVIIGNTKNYEFITNEYFEYEKKDFINLCQAIICIVKTIALAKGDKGILIEKDVDLRYFWIYESSMKIVFLGIEKDPNIIFKIPFTLNEFNDFILILTQLLLPSLCIDIDAMKLLDFASNCSPNEIVQIKTFHQCSSYLESKNFPIPNNYHCAYLLYYKEIIVVLNRLKSMFNYDIKNNPVSNLLTVQPD